MPDMTKQRPKLPRALTEPGPAYVFEFATAADREKAEALPNSLLRFCCELGHHEFLYLAPAPRL